MQGLEYVQTFAILPYEGEPFDSREQPPRARCLAGNKGKKLSSPTSRLALL